MFMQVQLGSTVPPHVAGFVRRHVDPYLADVHTMLHAYLPPDDQGGGCNFAAVEVLCAVVSGLSRAALPRVKGAGKAFRSVLRLYPKSQEPTASLPPNLDFADALYTVYRCTLAHSLGMNVQWSDAQRMHRIEPLTWWTSVRRFAIPDRHVEMLAALDRSGSRPTWLPPTLCVEGRTLHLCPEALYWGVRRMVAVAAEDAAFVEGLRLLLSTAPSKHGLSAAGVPGPRFRGPTAVASTATTPPSGDVEGFEEPPR